MGRGETGREGRWGGVGKERRGESGSRIRKSYTTLIITRFKFFRDIRSL